MSCYIYKCTSRKRDVKPHLFRPKDEKQLEEWQNLVQRNSKLFTAKSQICHIHFDPKYIVSDFIHNVNGNIVKIPKCRWKILPKAIPEFYLHEDAVKDRVSEKFSNINVSLIESNEDDIQQTLNDSSYTVNDIVNVQENELSKHLDIVDNFALKNNITIPIEVENNTEDVLKFSNINVSLIESNEDDMQQTLNDSSYTVNDIVNVQENELSKHPDIVDNFALKNNITIPIEVGNNTEDVFENIDAIDLPSREQWSVKQNAHGKQVTFLYHEKQDDGTYYPIKQVVIEQLKSLQHQCSVKLFIRFKNLDLSQFPDFPLYWSNVNEIEEILKNVNEMTICCGAQPTEKLQDRKFAELCSLVIMKGNESSRCKTRCKSCELLLWANTKRPANLLDLHGFR